MFQILLDGAEARDADRWRRTLTSIIAVVWLFDRFSQWDEAVHSSAKQQLSSTKVSDIVCHLVYFFVVYLSYTGTYACAFSESLSSLL